MRSAALRAESCQPLRRQRYTWRGWAGILGGGIGCYVALLCWHHRPTALWPHDNLPPQNPNPKPTPHLHPGRVVPPSLLEVQWSPASVLDLDEGLHLTQLGKEGRGEGRRW